MKTTAITWFAPLLVAALPALACGGSDPAPAAPAPPATSVAPVAATLAPPPAPTVARPAWAAEYPASRVEETKDVMFGTEVKDPYRWLEDAKSPEVQAWMKAQDDLTRSKIAAVPERAAIAARLKELFYVDAQSIPITRGTRVFYSRRSGAQEKSVLYWREGKKGAEKVLLDPNAWSADGSASLHHWSVSWDGKHIAYTVSQNNSDTSTLKVMDVTTGKESAIDTIDGARYAYASWTPKGDAFYYAQVDTDPKIPVDERPGHVEIRLHTLGVDPKTDKVIHAKTGDPTTFVGASISKDGRFLFYEVARGSRATDIWYRDLQHHMTGPAARAMEWTPLAVGKDAQYGVEAYKGRFYVMTNEGAPKWRVFTVDPLHPQRDAWKELIPERQDAKLDSFEILGGKLALTYLKDVTSRIELHDLDGKLIREVKLPAIGSAGIAGDDDRDEAYYAFETFNYPFEIHTTSIAKGGDETWFKQKVPVDPTAFAVDQVFATSKDGTKVPLFVVRKKDTPKDGTAPAILFGYGGFQISETPRFSKTVIPWMEHGGIAVFSSLRGGGEYGEEWHRAGMKHLKQNVFDDFEASAEYLAKEKWTSADRLVIRGGSNGGLLVGAALTQRPELFRAVICEVPLIDMVRYTKFGSGRTWVEEYGSPDVEDDFKALFAYSPYHHVVPGTKYPSVLIGSADSDDRVDPMHARKFAAALQAASTGGPVLLRIERHSGHGGADMMKAAVDEIADQYAFALAEIRQVGGVMSK